jgi:hypothetical protein
MKKKIGFIYFDNIHHIPHFFSVFAELYKLGKYDVKIITYKAAHSYLKSLLDLYEIPYSVIFEAPTYAYRTILNKIRPHKRERESMHFLLKYNRNFLFSHDALVFNSAKHYLLKRHQKKNNTTKFLFLDHGAGDRNYIYNEKITDFDLVAIAGKKVYDMCVSSADFSKTNIKVCGYQKFDVAKKENSNIKLFNNNKITVVYNPHFVKELSSFYKLGNQVLEFFYNNDNYNLIFAPHINVFNQRGFLNKEDFDNKYLNAPNIIVDFGSVKSINMAYTINADVYLGDVSSQVYEFLLKPRPCIFINAHNVNWKGNDYYRSWSLGKVITSVDELTSVLATIDVWQKEFKENQKQIANYVFSLDNKEAASKRIVNEIIKIV